MRLKNLTDIYHCLPERGEGYLRKIKDMITLILGDCNKYLAGCKDKQYSLGIVDPPYGINRDSGFGGFGKPIERKKYNGKWDDKTPDKEYFDDLLRVCTNVIIWGGQFFTDKLPQGSHWIFWDKINTMPTFGDGELAYTNFDRSSVKRFVFQYNGLLGRENEERIHATQKPIQLYKYLLKNYAKNEYTILDTHGGSMSSVIACIDGGFDMTCIELDPDYFDAGVKRVQNHVKQLDMFIARPEIKIIEL